MKVCLKVQTRILPLCLLAMTIEIAGPAAATVSLITVSQAQDTAKMMSRRCENESLNLAPRRTLQLCCYNATSLNVRLVMLKRPLRKSNPAAASLA